MIQIIDGFKLNASTPVDSRFVVADDTERTNITYLYHGLRVWQKDTNEPWFYDGSIWISELDLVVTGSGTVDNVPKITSSSPLKIGDSQISDNGTIVNISNDLTVGNDITFSGNLTGIINADNITTGTLSLNILQTSTGTNGQVLQIVGTNPTWVNLNALSIGTSDSSNTVKINSTNSSGSYRLVLCGGSAGSSEQLYTKNNGIKIKEASGELRILAHNGAVDRPPYSFDNSDKTGIYSPYSNQIGLSIDGSEIARFASTFTKFNAGGSEKARFYSSGIFFYDKTQFNFTTIYDRLYIYDNSSKNTSSSPTFEVKNTTSNKNLKTSSFISGSNQVFISPNVSTGGYSANSQDGDAIIKLESYSGLVIGSRRNVDSNGFDCIRIWQGRLQVGEINNSNQTADRLYIRKAGVDRYSLNVDDTFFVKPGEIQMLRKTYEQYVVGNTQPDGGTSTCWITNLSSGVEVISKFGDIRSIFTASDPYDYTMPSVDYDRYITIKFGADVPAQYTSIGIFVENGVGTKDFVDTSIVYAEFNLLTKNNSAVTAAVDYSGDGSVSKVSALVPANCRWAGYLNMVDNSGTAGIKPKAVVTIQRFGI